VRPGGVERGEACGGVGNPRPIYNGVTETDLGGRRRERGGIMDMDRDLDRFSVAAPIHHPLA